MIGGALALTKTLLVLNTTLDTFQVSHVAGVLGESSAGVTASLGNSTSEAIRVWSDAINGFINKAGTSLTAWFTILCLCI